MDSNQPHTITPDTKGSGADPLANAQATNEASENTRVDSGFASGSNSDSAAAVISDGSGPRLKQMLTTTNVARKAVMAWQSKNEQGTDEKAEEKAEEKTTE